MIYHEGGYSDGKYMNLLTSDSTNNIYEWLFSPSFAIIPYVPLPYVPMVPQIS